MPNNTEPIPAEAYEIDLYAVLQITPRATAVDVRTAFRGLILKHHPDKVQPSERTAAHGQYLEISFAYSILGDANKRKIYDDVRYLLKEKEKADSATKQRPRKRAERPPTPRPDDSPFRPRHSGHKQNPHPNTGRQAQQQGPGNGPFWRFGSDPRSDPQPAHNKPDDTNLRRWAHAAQPDSQYPPTHFYNAFRYSNEAAGSGRSKMKGHHSKVKEDGYRTGSEYDPQIFDYQRTSESGFTDPTDFKQPGLAKDGASTEKNRDDEQWGRYSGYHYAKEDGTATPAHKHSGANWGTDLTRSYENEPFESNNSLRGKFHTIGPSQSHFSRGSGRRGERKGYFHVLRESTLPR